MMPRFPQIFVIFLMLSVSCDQAKLPTIDAFSFIQTEKFDGEIGRVDNGSYKGISRFDKVITYSGIRSFDTGDVLVFKNVDFQDGAQSVTLNLAQNWGEPDGTAKIEFRLDHPDGKLIGTHEVIETAGWEHYMFQATNITKVTGIHDLYLVADHLRGVGDIDWFMFSRHEVSKQTLAPTPKSDPTSNTSENGNRYYIDSENGSDGDNGHSPEKAWKSHTMISTITFEPGDVIAFKKESHFNGPIVFSESGTKSAPILITSYGEGQKPRFTNPDDSNMNGNCIRIYGSWIIVENLHFHNTPATENSNRLQSIFMMGALLNAEDANHNIIRNNDFTDVTKGIQSTGEHTLITGNYMEGVPNSLWWNGGFGSWGPMGIQLGIGNQEVSYNIIKNFLSTESGYGSDGGAIEIDDGRFHKDNIFIHHNYTEGNAGFLESSWTHDYNPFVQEVHNLRVAFNVNYDGQSWLYMWAPCHDCYFDNNTVIRNNDFRSPLYNGVYADFEGINFRNNLFVLRYDAFLGNTSQIRSNNWYMNFDQTGEVLWDSIETGSGDPRLVNLIGGDFNLTSESPLRGEGINLSKFYKIDFNGTDLPESGVWDIGAIQYK
ncbi:MAG: carbohydrate-binding protein [Maribacter sp.]|nr:carbohydrate-binding protein [Maribacter sp.]